VNNTSKKFRHFSAIFRKICQIFCHGFFRLLIFFLAATFVFCGQNFGQLATLALRYFCRNFIIVRCIVKVKNFLNLITLISLGAASVLFLRTKHPSLMSTGRYKLMHKIDIDHWVFQITLCKMLIFPNRILLYIVIFF
jgi:hypothetical protein